MEKTFSLIVATIGRYNELQDLLKSIRDQTFDVSKIEVLILDQNEDIDLIPLVNKYSRDFKIDHFRSKVKGLSVNRNEGLKYATGKIIAFPDDDCKYYKNTLSVVNEIFQNNSNYDVVLGRMIDKEKRTNIIRNWKEKPFDITKYNFYYNLSSGTIFVRANDILFEEQLGLGKRNGSCEDADYVINLMKRGKSVRYDPRIEIWHPEMDIHTTDRNKIIGYGLGFGFMCRKHLAPFIIRLFILVIGFHFLRLLFAFVKMDKKEISGRYWAISSRLRGFFEYRHD